MSGNVEFSTGVRRGDFPTHWGNPVGTPYSDERRKWITSNVLDDQLILLRAVRAGDPAARLRLARKAETEQRSRDRQAQAETDVRADLASGNPARLLRAAQALSRVS